MQLSFLELVADLLEQVCLPAVLPLIAITEQTACLIVLLAVPMPEPDQLVDCFCVFTGWLNIIGLVCTAATLLHGGS